MSPQENVSGSTSISGEKTSFSPVCAEVRVVMDAVRDNRATPAERVFVASHTEHCAGCASEWAFLLATKTAWAQAPTALPSASLSARIAAATYRKPTFAERFASAFAFLNPAPVRVAIGVAAVAGVSFLVLPRQPMMTEDEAPVIARNAPRETAPVPEAEVVAVPVIKKPSPAIKKETPKPIATVSNEVPVVVAAKPSLPLKKDPVALTPVNAPKLTPKAAPAVKVPKPTQVAIARIKPAPRQRPETPSDSAAPSVTPTVRETDNGIAATPPPAPSVAVTTPEIKSPAAVASATIAGMIAPENDPGFADGSNRIKLNNAMQPLSAPMSGKVVRAASSSEDYSLVSAPTRL